MKQITKQDLKDELKTFAKQIRKELNPDLINIDKRFERLTEEINKKPDREEFPQLLDRVLEYTTLKIEHEHIKRVLKDKLGVEV